VRRLRGASGDLCYTYLNKAKQYVQRARGFSCGHAGPGTWGRMWTNIRAILRECVPLL
jgi:hypothetical protein